MDGFSTGFTTARNDQASGVVLETAYVMQGNDGLRLELLARERQPCFSCARESTDQYLFVLYEK